MKSNIQNKFTNANFRRSRTQLYLILQQKIIKTFKLHGSISSLKFNSKQKFKMASTQRILFIHGQTEI